jgi:hypothetical protein
VGLQEAGHRALDPHQQRKGFSFLKCFIEQNLDVLRSSCRPLHDEFRPSPQKARKG